MEERKISKGSKRVIMNNYKITVLVDNNSWIIPYAQNFVETINADYTDRYRARFIRHAGEIERGEILFLLGCTKILKPELLAFNLHNLVVHESALPQGKGFAPLFWQILEGQNTIPMTLFEASEAVDDGDIYHQINIELQGHELNEEIRDIQGRKTMDICLQFLEAYPDIQGQKQQGVESFYKRRRPEDSELDIHKTIDEQFHNLRIANNDFYPAFFVKDGYKYILSIKRDDSYEPDTDPK
jgi:methionyl-tRNA formyltransferase